MPTGMIGMRWKMCSRMKFCWTTVYSRGNPRKGYRLKLFTERWSAFLPGFDITQHKNTNHRVVYERDVVQVHTDVRAIHYIEGAEGGGTWIVDGAYDIELRKFGGDFKVTALVFNFDKTIGNNELPNLAQKRAEGLPY